MAWVIAQHWDRLAALGVLLGGVLGCAADDDTPAATPGHAETEAAFPAANRPVATAGVAAPTSAESAEQMQAAPPQGMPPSSAVSEAGNMAGDAVATTDMPFGGGMATTMTPTAAAPADCTTAAPPCMDAAPADPASCAEDPCPFSVGVPWACNQRFMHGVNYAWHHFGGDFGGVTQWGLAGVSQNGEVDAELADMASSGVSVVRWWLWPDFRGDGVQFDDVGMPTGLGGSALADLERALQLAEVHDLYLMLTLFSFDNFRPTREDGGILIHGMTDLLRDASRRDALLQRVVAPFARAAESSAHAERLIAWDIINEPEWAIAGASLYGGDPDFDPMDELATVGHGEMESFLQETAAVLRAESHALITVGATAMKWRNAWSQVDTDFEQFHMYDWINEYWPYHMSPQQFGLRDDKPVVMGEFPLSGLTGVDYGMLVGSWHGNGYAGALGWAYTDDAFGDLNALQQFSSSRECELRY